ncbi:hypothetical protein CEXT_316551 [Caerostris extrusa]|uniref:Uncharacterized protein n=1 Tax=Caerostris extrusa TaxID=172846 RepID=A0AAV4TVB1_CAEEX|nr:hypothetical protein CEXT_316551 [Caerostris extrusa]
MSRFSENTGDIFNYRCPIEDFFVYSGNGQVKPTFIRTIDIHLINHFSLHPDASSQNKMKIHPHSLHVYITHHRNRLHTQNKDMDKRPTQNPMVHRRRIPPLFDHAS